MNRVFRIVFLIISFNIIGGAQETYLNIDASFFESDEVKQLLIFRGDVKMTKNKDILLCDKLVINTVPSKENPKKQIPKDYKATGNVHFTIYTAQNILKGKGDIVFYYPDELKYIIVGNGFLENINEGKKVNANRITIDNKTGHTTIDGDENKPIKFRLKIEEKEKK